MTDIDKLIDEIMELDKQRQEAEKNFRDTTRPCYADSGAKAAALAMKLKLELHGKAPEMISIIRELQAQVVEREEVLHEIENILNAPDLSAAARLAGIYANIAASNKAGE